MEQLTTFVANHYMLWAALAVVIGLLLSSELKPRLSGLTILSPREATNHINRHDAALIDLRDQTQYEAGHIAGAIHIALEKAEQDLEQFAKYKDKGIILVCNDSSKSFNFGNVLRKKGFESVNILKEGMLGWQNANLPTVRD